MSKPKIRVGRSPIHGKGLFAAAPIAEGEVLGHLRTRAARKDGPYVLWLDDGRGREVLCDFRYINHHPEPNVAYYDDLTVVALRDIEPGEELVHHYGDEWEDA